jgi:hypothetical protein
MISDMNSGECKWVGRPGIHVYCHNPHPRTDDSARYRVVTTSSRTDWLPEAEALAALDRLLEEARP